MAFRGKPFGNLNQCDVAVLINPAQYPDCMGLGSMAVTITTNRIRLNAPRCACSADTSAPQRQWIYQTWPQRPAVKVHLQ